MLPILTSCRSASSRALLLLTCALLAACSTSDTPVDPDPIPVVIRTSATTLGLVDPTEQRAMIGETVTFQALPNKGHHTVSVRGCEGELDGITFTMTVTEACTLTPQFRETVREDVADLFVEQTIVEGNYTLTYHLYTPELEANKQYPLVLAIHGTVEGGVAAQGVENPHLVDDLGEDIGRPVATGWIQPHVRDDYPAYVLAPLVPTTFAPDEPWADAFLMRLFDRIIQTLIETEQVDPDRIYVTGHSIGASQTWFAPAIVADRFAALLPTSGVWIDPENGDTPESTVAREYPYLSVWSFGHRGDGDGRVVDMRQMHAAMDAVNLTTTQFENLDAQSDRRDALQKINQPLRYFATEYSFQCGSQGGGCHYAATDTMATEPLMYAWLFQQHRIDPDALELTQQTYLNDELTLSWCFPNAGRNHTVTIWLSDGDNWQRLEEVRASTATTTQTLTAAEVRGERIRLTLTDNEGFVYGVVDSDVLLD